MKSGWQFYQDVWQPAALVVSRMEQHGLALDVDLCRQREAECITKQQEIGETLNEWAGKEINWASPKQKAEFFYTTRGWPVPTVCGNTRAVKRTKPGAAPTDEMAVVQLARTVHRAEDREHLRLYCGYPDVKARENEQSWKKAEKLKGFYAALPEHAAATGRVHTQLGAMTRTGRLASRNPNLQQIAPVVREVFLATPGYVFLEADYSALEWLVLGHIIAKRYGDFSIVEETRQGVDPHQSTATSMSEKLGRTVGRPAAKILNYSVNYKKTAGGLGIQLEIPEHEAEKLLETFFIARPGIARWHEDAWEYVKTRKYCRTLLGRYLPIPEVEGNRWDRIAAERKAVSFPIQGSAMDIVSAATIGCSETFNPRLREMGTRLVLQVHDSLLFEVPEAVVDEAKAEITEQMVGSINKWTEFLCPLSVSVGIGKTWGACGK